jgi:hypothetical protein
MKQDINRRMFLQVQKTFGKWWIELDIAVEVFF